MGVASETLNTSLTAAYYIPGLIHTLEALHATGDMLHILCHFHVLCDVGCVAPNTWGRKPMLLPNACWHPFQSSPSGTWYRACTLLTCISHADASPILVGRAIARGHRDCDIQRLWCTPDLDIVLWEVPSHGRPLSMVAVCHVLCSFSAEEGTGHGTQ